jgi:catechol 2,3-dioxygenase-like lactoylglutathione lyase family enzyme
VFDHVTVRASDQGASDRFYTTVLTPLGIEQTSAGEHGAEWDDFSVAPAGDGKPVTRRLHVAFVAPSPTHVDAFWRAATSAGYRDDGWPGPRKVYRHDYYGAFVLDPDGNSVEAVHHGVLRQDGNVDHVWIRVAELAESRSFYETVADHAGFGVKDVGPERVQIVGETGSFSVVAGKPTEHVHLAFPAAENAVVDAFHRALTGAGYRDNGLPGERPVYHEGYYGAFVLDPDGNNVELVCHNR